jgi:uncharacterized small protein (TIGR04563 family)
MADRRKQSLYLTDEVLDFLRREAERQDRSISWLVQKAVEVAQVQITKFPGAPG